MYNRSLFYRYVESAFPGQAGEQDPLPGNITEQDWWDNFVEEIAYSGQDYVAMNCRGMANDNVDHGRPDKLLDLMAAIERNLKSQFSMILPLHGLLPAMRIKDSDMPTNR